MSKFRIYFRLTKLEIICISTFNILGLSWSYSISSFINQKTTQMRIGIGALISAIMAVIAWIVKRKKS